MASAARFLPEFEVPPFSFRYGGKPSAALLPAWNKQVNEEETPGGGIQHIRFTDPETGLRVTAHVRRFTDFPAVDWFLEIGNAGTADSPLIEQILPLDVNAPVAAEERVRLHSANGSLCQMDDFLPHVADLGFGVKKMLTPKGGRSSNGVLPFMNLQRDGCGMVLGIGWSGQWAAAFERAKDHLRIGAGMEKTHLVLYPGEKIRTPRMLLVFWEGADELAGQNLLRRLLLAHYLPRVNGELVTPPVAQCLQFHYYLTGQAGEQFEMKALPKAAPLGVEDYWIDACWYGRSGREWWEEVGSWTVNKDRFPNGLRPISDAARKAGMKFVLWFEPERVRQGSMLDQEHPEFLLRRSKDPGNLLYNLGQPEARRHITELISRQIKEHGVDVYRQDFNFDPLPYWQEADAPSRVGMTEIRHIEGLYEFWDELRRRHKGLWIDNCASGGRRIDLETLSRSLPLWPSDFLDTVGVRHGMNLHVGDQCLSAGLAQWLPLFGGGLWNFTPYGLRSRLSAGFMFGYHTPFEAYAADDAPRHVDFKDVLRKAKSLLDDDFPAELARKAIAEWKSLRPFLTGDFFPLLPITAAPHDWCAYQYHRDEPASGIALFFRRHRSPFPAMQVELRRVDPAAQYEVSLSAGFEEGPRQQMAGSELAKLTIAIPERPGCILLRYTRKA